MIGHTFGRFRVVAPLGEGGMGTVWRAHDPGLDRDVALKLLSPALLASDAARRRFLREGRAASSLTHPGIAIVHDVGESDGQLWLATQLIEGESLAKRCEHGPLSIAEAVALARGLAEALGHAHAHGVLHRDVTAGNVMVTPEGRAVLVDFGLARPEGAAQLTSTGALLGTAGYVAPEVLRGEPADARSDLYGLGAVLHLMLTGRLPFAGGAPEAQMYRALNEQVPPPSELRPELPGALDALVVKLLAREPADRYASAAEVTEALREVAPERGPTPAERRRRAWAKGWRRTKEALRRAGRRRVGVTVLAGAALLAAAAWFAVQRGWIPGLAVKPPMLAVLPFRNLTDDPEATQYIADGLAEAMATNLAQSERLRVLPWVTTQRAKLEGVELPRLARDLRARRLLLGSLHSAPQGLRVSLSLVDGRDGSQLWSRPFEGAADELPSLEARILFEAATAMVGPLTDHERTLMSLPSGRDGRAYNLYLEGAAHLRADDAVSLATAEQFFLRALELDSTFAEAHVGLGAVHNSLYFEGLEGEQQGFDRARHEFMRAVALDPASPLVMRSMLSIHWQLRQSVECLEIGQRAARMRPHTLQRRIVAAEAYVLGGLPDVGLRLSESVLGEDPSNPAARFWAVVGAAWSNENNVALEQGAEYIRRFGEDGEIYIWMSVAAARLRQADRAIAFSRRAAALEGERGDPRSMLFVALTAEEFQGPAAARAAWQVYRDVLVERLRDSPDQIRLQLQLLGTLVVLGEREHALSLWGALDSRVRAGGDIPLPDLDDLPYLLVRMGLRQEAQRVIEYLLSHGHGPQAGGVRHRRTLLGNDPMLSEFERQRSQIEDRLRARFGEI
jgi:TolB-like protein